MLQGHTCDGKNECIISPTLVQGSMLIAHWLNDDCIPLFDYYSGYQILA